MIGYHGTFTFSKNQVVEHSVMRPLCKLDNCDFIVGMATAIGIYSDPLKRTIEAISSAGFDCIELTAIAEYKKELLGSDLSHVRNLLQREGLKVFSVHAPCKHENEMIDIASSDVELREYSIEQISSAIRSAAELECSVVVIHPAAKGTARDRSEWADSMEISRASLERLLDLADREDVCLAAENLKKPHAGSFPNFCHCLEGILSLVHSIDHPRLMVCLDTGHFACENNFEIASAVELCGNKLITLHVHDVNRSFQDHLPPGSGMVDFTPFLQKLKETGYGDHSVLMFESIGHENDLGNDMDVVISKSIEGIKNILSGFSFSGLS